MFCCSIGAKLRDWRKKNYLVFECVIFIHKQAVSGLQTLKHVTTCHNHRYYIRPQYDQQRATAHTNIHTAVECTVQGALWIRLNETFNLFVDLDQNSYSLETEGWV